MRNLVNTKGEKRTIYILMSALLIIVCSIIALMTIPGNVAEEPKMQTYELEMPQVHKMMNWYEEEKNMEEEWEEIRNDEVDMNKL